MADIRGNPRIWTRFNYLRPRGVAPRSEATDFCVLSFLAELWKRDEEMKDCAMINRSR